MPLTITGGRVVTPTGVRRADVLIEGERVAGLAKPGGQSADRIEADGCYVLPGGIDTHTHLLADVAAATRSAAWGGTTTALCLTNPQPGESAAAGVARARQQLEGQSAIDVALHAVLAEPDRVTAEDLDRVEREGARVLKLFLAYPELGLMASDASLYRILRWAASREVLVRVHCENGGVIQALIDDFLRQGKRQVGYFVRSRPPAVEEEAIARTLAIARLAESAVYINHISTAGGIELVRAARVRRQLVHTEICLHHLVLDASRYARSQADRFLVVPPLRSRDDVQALWRGVASGVVDAIGSDHAQSLYQPPPTDDFTGLPYGMAGIELRLPLLLSEGLRRRVPIQRLVQVAATRPAQIFGLFPRKGAIIAGADADLVVWDSRRRWRVKASALHDGLGQTPYEGMAVKGVIRHVLLRGEVLIDNGQLVGPAVRGRCLTLPNRS